MVPEFLAGLATNLATDVLKASYRRVRTAFGDDERRALELAFRQALNSLAADIAGSSLQGRALTRDEFVLVMEQLARIVQDPLVIALLTDVVTEGRQLPISRLRRRLHELDLDEATMLVDFESAMTSFQRTLADELWVAAGAASSPLFNRVVLTRLRTLLDRQVRLEQTILENPGTASVAGSGSGNGSPSWPVLVGQIPARASGFQQREDIQARLDQARSADGAVVPTHVLSGGGGVGKTQLAALYARRAVGSGTDLVVWVHAHDADRIVATYAQAALRIQARSATGADAVADAMAFLEWLASTDRSWFIVLDDVDPAAITTWWPVSHRAAGRVLATTRRRDAVLSGGGRIVVPVDVYSADQSIAYLTERLTEATHAELVDEGIRPLAIALGHLPLALSHAAAYMINLQMRCAEYAALFKDRQTRLEQLLPPDTDTEEYGREVTVTLLLALDAIQERHPDIGGLVSVVLRLIAMLDPAGQPAALWNGSVDIGPRANAQSGTALSLLHRYALIDYSRKAEPQAIRIHTLTARAVRERVVPEMHAQVVKIAAHLLWNVWPASDHSDPELAYVLRANASVLLDHGQDDLWRMSWHELIMRAGESYLTCGDPTAAVKYWEAAAHSCERVFGHQHLHQLNCLSNLASAYGQAGRLEDAVTLLSAVIATQEELLGPDDPNVFAARVNLAVFTRRMGHAAEAVPLLQQLLVDAPRILGDDSPLLLKLRNNLVLAYAYDGRADNALHMQEELLADATRQLGPDDPDTLTIKANLADFYLKADRAAQAIPLLEGTVTARRTTQGVDHPSTLTAKHLLAAAYWDIGRRELALRVIEDVLPDRVRVLGVQHPDTVETRSALAHMYQLLGLNEKVIELLEPTLEPAPRSTMADRGRLLSMTTSLIAAYTAEGRTGDAVATAEALVRNFEDSVGPDHFETLNPRGILSDSYRNADRLADAIVVEEQIAHQIVRVFGHDDRRTLRTQNNLAHSYGEAGRFADAVQLGETVLAEATRVLGAEDELTLTIAHNLGGWYSGLGRIREALTYFERAAEGRSRTLSPHHRDTLTSRASHMVLVVRTTGSPEAIAHLRHLRDEMASALGRDDPDTQAVATALLQATVPPDQG